MFQDPYFKLKFYSFLFLAGTACLVPLISFIDSYGLVPAEAKRGSIVYGFAASIFWVFCIFYSILMYGKRELWHLIAFPLGLFLPLWGVYAVAYVGIYGK